MTPEQQDKMTELREKISVGIKYGIDLLELNQWDSEKAASQFKLEVIQRLGGKRKRGPGNCPKTCGDPSIRLDRSKKKRFYQFLRQKPWIKRRNREMY